MPSFVGAVPPKPKRLRSDATEEEKAERKRLMAERHRAQKVQHESTRQRRDRPDRDRMSDPSGYGNRRGARILFNEARRRPLPLVTAETHSELVRLTNAYEAAGAARCFGLMGCNTKGGCVHAQAFWQAHAQVREAWQAVLQRQLPQYGCDFSLDEDGDPEYDRGEWCVRRASLKPRGPDELELRYGLYYGRHMHSGEIHNFTNAGARAPPSCHADQPHVLSGLCRSRRVRNRNLA